MNPFSVFEENFLLIKPSGARFPSSGIWADAHVTVHATTFNAAAGDIVERSVGTNVERRDVVGVRFERGTAGMPDAYHLDLSTTAARAAQTVTHNTTYNIYGSSGAIGPGATAIGNAISSTFTGVMTSKAQRAQTIWNATLEQNRTAWKCQAQRVGVLTLELLPDETHAGEHERLRQLVQRAQTVWGGWSLPTFREGNTPQVQNRDGLIEGKYTRAPQQEVWQLHESGHFMLGRKLRYHNDNRGRRFIPFEDIVHGVAMGLVFAQRLYVELTPKLVGYRFALTGVRNHLLGTVSSREVAANPSQSAGEDLIAAEGSACLADLQADWRSVVLEVTDRIFRIFSAAKPRSTIEKLLEEFVPQRQR